jgi:crotonobetainyl-CoA:carnitine CoA-transferase CaiB-like acyl-CoA transferase
MPRLEPIRPPRYLAPDRPSPPRESRYAPRFRAAASCPLDDVRVLGAPSALTALRVVETGGSSQVVDLSLIEPVLAMLGPKTTEYRLSGATTARMGGRCNIQALRDVYATSDGKCVALSTGTQGMAERLLCVEIEVIVKQFSAART